MSRKIYRNNYRRLNLFIKQLKYKLCQKLNQQQKKNKNSMTYGVRSIMVKLQYKNIKL